MKNEKYLINNFFVKFLFLLRIIKFYNFSCSKNSPFLKQGICVTYCNEEEIKNELCILDNPIIKAQWINNINYISENGFNYINMAITQNDDLIILISTFPTSNKRLLYGITKEGRGYFNEEKKILKEINDPTTIGRFESEMFMFKLSPIDSTTEYLLSFGKTPQLAEIYDLNTKNIVFHSPISTWFYELFDVKQIVGAYLKLTTNDYNYYLIGLLSIKYDTYGHGTPILSLIKFRINSLGSIIQKTHYTKEINVYNSKVVSCYEMSAYYIICFYKNEGNKYTMRAFTSNLEEKQYSEIAPADENDNKYFKCVHFYGEIGAFLYYSNDNPPYANIVFKKYCTSSDSISNVFSKMTFNDYLFNYNCTLNDIIKVFDKKIIFSAASLDNSKLYIISIYNYDQEKIIQRIYEINSFAYNNYKFYNVIRIQFYNNFLAFGSNGFSADASFSTLIIFSYPNSTDINNELTEYLINNNDIKINKINLEIKNLCKIDNNVFGYILTGIKIIEIYKTTNEYLSIEDGTEIKVDMNLPIDANVKLIIPKNGNIYTEFTYGMKYICQAKEPEYEDYNKYPISILDTGTSNKEDSYFVPQTYSGRYSYYYYLLDNKLTEEHCDKECELCYYTNKNNCVTCILDYFDISGNIKKCKKEEEVFCSFVDIIKGNCRGELTDEMSKDIYLYIKNQMINKNFTEDNLIIKTPSVAFQLTTVDYQKNNNFNISIIDLGECEKKLREKYEIDKEHDLIIYKIDIQDLEKSLTYVQYEVYHPKTFKKLNLDICNNVMINISIPAILDSETILLYQNLDNFGFNLFNSNDIFYSDICTKFTSINKTDLLLIDRKKDIFNRYANITICQENCNLESYNHNSKRVSCFCNTQLNDSNIDLDIKQKFNFREINEIFYNYLNNSNFRVLKCYKVALDLTTFFENIGRIIITIIILVYIVLFILFLIKGNKQISLYLNEIKLLKKNQNFQKIFQIQ